MTNLTTEAQAMCERLLARTPLDNLRNPDGPDAAALIQKLLAERERMRDLLGSIRWKSDDKDNMEFASRITCFTMDSIRSALSDGGEAGA